MRGWGASGRGAAVTVLVLGVTLAGCSTSGTVSGPGKPTGSTASVSGSPTSAPRLAGSPTTAGPPSSSASPDVTVTQAEALATLKAYQGQNNAANAHQDTAALAKIESGSLLALDQASALYDQGAGGDRAKKDEAPMALDNPAFYMRRATGYPRGFFAVAEAVAAGSPNTSVLMEFTQDHAGAPWLLDTDVMLLPGHQWPAFAVGADGVLDDSATRQDKLPLDTVDLTAADKSMLADGNAGQPSSPFSNDDVTTAEQRWIQAESDAVAPASVALTVSTELDPAPTYLPLKNGGALALYGTRTSLRISQSGRTFTFGDPGWTKIAGTDTFDGGFTAEAVWMAAAIDPPDKSAKIQKIAYNGGLVSVH